MLSYRTSVYIFLIARKQLIEQLKKQAEIRSTSILNSNLRYNLLNYLHRPAVEDFSQFLESLVLF